MPLMKGRDRCTLLMHDDDAASRGISDGAVVTVTSSAGSLDVPIELTDAIKPGVVSMPHGWATASRYPDSGGQRLARGEHQCALPAGIPRRTVG
jgi:anaerobic selenocysteine-containing dehydrogenase